LDIRERKRKLQETGQNYIVMNFMICTLYQMLDHVRTEKLKERVNLENLGMDGRIIMK